MSSSSARGAHSCLRLPTTLQVLEKIDDVIMRHVRRVEMQRGDVVLLDSYQACSTDARPA